MDPITVGRKVQEMYPEYADKDPAQVGNRYLLKYGDDGVKSLGLTVPEDEKPKDLNEAEGKFSIGLNAAETALKQLEEGQQTGPIATRRQQLGEMFGRTEGTQFRSNIDLANTAIKSAFLGAAQSEQELKGAKGFIINPTDQEEVIKEKLEAMMPLIRERLGEDVADATSEAVKESTGVSVTPGFSQGNLIEGQDFVRDAVDQETGKKKEGLDLIQPGKNVAQAVADTAPFALGTLGAIGGGAVGATAGGVGAIPGAAGGAVAGTAGGKAVQNAIENLIGTQDQTGVEQVKDAGIQSAIAGAFELVGGTGAKLVGKGGSQVLKMAGSAVDDIPLKNIRVNPSQINKFAKKHGQDIGDFIVKNDLMGETGIETAMTKAGQLQDQFDQLAMNENITIPVTKLKDRFASELRALAGVSDEGVKTDITPSINKNIAKKVLDEWSNILDQLDLMGAESLTPKQLTTFRRQMDEIIPDSKFVDHDVRNIALRIRKIFNDVTREGVDERLIGEGDVGSLKNLGQDLSKYYDFLEIAEKQSGLGRGNKLGSFFKRALSLGGAGGGFAVGGPVGGVAGGLSGLALELALEDPAVLKALYQGGRTGVSGAQRMSPALGATSRILGPATSVGSAELLVE